jgi:phosphoribosyl-ATP pyrophosphohydrolase/phosphoribosyl-AMP cyclohydrolase
METVSPESEPQAFVQQVHFDAQGLIPAVVQDAGSGQVRMLGYMNVAALRATIESGRLTFWSRSRRTLWQKGETSGNVHEVVEIRPDCDGDALLVRVDQVGPACHTGEHTCFFSGDLTAAPHEALPGLERTVDARIASPSGYTGKLLADPPFIGEKVQEEAEEVARAAREESDERVAEEAADVLYHLTVLLKSRGLSLADAEEVLVGRRR